MLSRKVKCFLLRDLVAHTVKTLLLLAIGLTPIASELSWCETLTPSNDLLAFSQDQLAFGNVATTGTITTQKDWLFKTGKYRREHADPTLCDICNTIRLEFLTYCHTTFVTATEESAAGAKATLDIKVFIVRNVDANGHILHDTCVYVNPNSTIFTPVFQGFIWQRIKH